ncbi:hypothetical protein ACIPMT_00075 [Streptomyces griseus]|uniref:hypothetical protein n=1 Tax=Streptomyces griseus TaxID=1911 RepID=UPI0038286865
MGVRAGITPPARMAATGTATGARVTAAANGAMVMMATGQEAGSGETVTMATGATAAMATGQQAGSGSGWPGPR